jgi:hypothetical protein
MPLRGLAEFVGSAQPRRKYVEPEGDEVTEFIERSTLLS